MDQRQNAGARHVTIRRREFIGICWRRSGVAARRPRAAEGDAGDRLLCVPAVRPPLGSRRFTKD